MMRSRVPVWSCPKHYVHPYVCWTNDTPPGYQCGRVQNTMSTHLSVRQMIPLLGTSVVVSKTLVFFSKKVTHFYTANMFIFVIFTLTGK